MMRALLVLALAACGGQPPPANAGAGSGSVTRETLDSCETAEDCTLAPACCGCNAGGGQVAIRKDAVARFEASRPERCGHKMCPQFISHNPSCDAEPICNARHTCEVAAHMQSQ